MALILKRTITRGEKLIDDYEVFAYGRTIGRTMWRPQAPQDCPPTLRVNKGRP